MFTHVLLCSGNSQSNDYTVSKQENICNMQIDQPRGAHVSVTSAVIGFDW